MKFQPLNKDINLRIKKKIKLAQIITVAIVVLTFQYSAMAQEVKKSEEMKEKTFSIENCVNHFEQDKAVKTKVGFQYWFIDKDFIDGNTLKMSVVGPRLSTHPAAQAY